jgi:hypothetical protein
MPKPLLIFIAAGFLIAGIFVVFHRPGPCASIMEQTTQKLNLSVDVIKAKGALVIGGEKVQAFSAPSIDNPKPWTEAKAVIKLKNIKTVTVDAKTVSTYTDCGGDGLHLDYGQKILFKNMQSFSVLDEPPTIEFVPLNGNI